MSEVAPSDLHARSASSDLSVEILEIATDALEEIAELETYDDFERAPYIAAKAITEIKRKQVLGV